MSGRGPHTPQARVPSATPAGGTAGRLDRLARGAPVRFALAVAALSVLAAAGVGAAGGLAAHGPQLARGLAVTVQVACGAAAVAMIMALAAAWARLAGPGPLRWLAVAYVEFFRGTSALVQLFWLFFVLPHFGLSLSPLVVGIFGLGLNAGAYGAELVRGAVLAVPVAQWEAARSLNLSRSRTMQLVVLPQALATMLPPWGNLLIELLKATSLVSMITLADLGFKAQQIHQSTLRTVEVFSVVLLLYLALSLTITAGMRALERRATRWRPQAPGAFS